MLFLRQNLFSNYCTFERMVSNEGVLVSL